MWPSPIRARRRRYGKSYGYDFDSWDRNYWGSYAPEEIRQGLRVYFHAGGRYLMNEIACWNRDVDALTGWGTAWLDAVRFMRLHPQLGQQQVRIAVLRALGDDWNRVAGPSAAWEATAWLPRVTMFHQFQRPNVPWLWNAAKHAAGEPPNLRAVLTEQTYLADYDLLDLVFARFGHASRTDPNRLCTGTPFGPVDFIPWDTPLERLKGYQVILFLGRGVGIDGSTLANLTAYVRGGGCLALAAGQLRGEDDRFLAGDFLGDKLAATRLIEGTPQTAITPPPQSHILATLPGDNAPSLVRFPAARGQVLLASGEWLTAIGQQPLRKAIEELLAPARWLTFEPQSTWLEYMVQPQRRQLCLPIVQPWAQPVPLRKRRGPWTVGRHRAA